MCVCVCEGGRGNPWAPRSLNKSLNDFLLKQDISSVDGSRLEEMIAAHVYTAPSLPPLRNSIS